MHMANILAVLVPTGNRCWGPDRAEGAQRQTAVQELHLVFEEHLARAVSIWWQCYTLGSGEYSDRWQLLLVLHFSVFMSLLVHVMSLKYKNNNYTTPNLVIIWWGKILENTYYSCWQTKISINNSDVFCQTKNQCFVCVCGWGWGGSTHVNMSECCYMCASMQQPVC